MKTQLERLIELNEKTDDLLEFKKLYDPSTGQWVDDGTESNAAAKTIGRTVAPIIAGSLIHSGVTRAGGYGAVASKVRGQIAPVIAKAKPKLAALGNTVSTKVAALLAKLKGIRLESMEEQIITLNARLDDILEFKSSA